MVPRTAARAGCAAFAAVFGCSPSPPPAFDGGAPPPSSVPALPAASALGPPLQGAVQIALGDFYGCVRKEGGAVWCWGDNSYGQLGDGTTTSRSLPGPVKGLIDAAEIATGSIHTCARTAGGAVRCWGKNGLGQLGDGTTTDRLEPVAVAALPSATQIALATTGRSCAVLRDETVRCWGDTSWTVRASSPSPAPLALPRIDHASEIALGWLHGCARLSDGTVRCWGNNVLGACGDGGPAMEITTPVRVSGLADAAQIALGHGHTCAVGRDKKVRCWGSNKDGKLGDGTSTNRSMPVEVPELDGIEQVALGSDHSCALKTSGALLCWGSNVYGQLGDGTTASRTRPTPVPALAGVKQIALGAHHTCALLSGGSVSCWGRNDDGQLGFTTASTCGLERHPCSMHPDRVLEPRR